MELSAHRLRCQGKTCRNQGGKPESPGSDVPIPWENGESSDIERRAMVLILSLLELCTAFSRRIYPRCVCSGHAVIQNASGAISGRGRLLPTRVLEKTSFCHSGSAGASSSRFRRANNCVALHCDFVARRFKRKSLQLDALHAITAAADRRGKTAFGRCD